MNDTRASISSPIRMHQYCSHVRGRMKSSWWEKYRTCPPRSMWRRARAIVRPLFRFFIASDQNWIMQWTRAGGSGSASRSKSSEHHLSVHMEERYTHIYIYRHVIYKMLRNSGICIPEAEICSLHIYAKDTMHILLAQCKGCSMRRKYRLPQGTQISL